MQHSEFYLKKGKERKNITLVRHGKESHHSHRIEVGFAKCQQSSRGKIQAVKEQSKQWAMVVHAFNSSTQEAEAGRSL